MVPESSLQLKMLIYNNYESINLQKKLWDNAMRVHSQILHKCARTTDNHKVASLLKSAYNIKDKPSIRHKLPTVLTELEEQIICEFSRTTQLTFWRLFYRFKH